VDINYACLYSVLMARFYLYSMLRKVVKLSLQIPFRFAYFPRFIKKFFRVNLCFKLGAQSRFIADFAYIIGDFIENCLLLKLIHQLFSDTWNRRWRLLFLQRFFSALRDTITEIIG